MNVFNKLTIRTLLKNRTRTLVTIIGIMLSTALICAITTSVSSMQQYAREVVIYNTGDWHGSALSTDKGTYEKIAASKEVESAVYAVQLGYAIAEGCENENKPYLYILATGDRFENMLPVHLTEGAYPKTSGEILLPEHLDTNGGVKHELGDVISLEVGDRMLEDYPLGQYNPYIYSEYNEDEREEFVARETKTYTVVGFYERPDFEEYSAPGYTALTLAEENDLDKYACDVYFKMNKANDIYSFVTNNNLTCDKNTTLLALSGVMNQDGFLAMLYGLAAIVIILVVFGSISLIYNAFAISVSERTKQFGMLSSVGATKKQLKRMVFFEAFAVSLVGIPLGIIVGITGIGITLTLISGMFSNVFDGSIPVTLHLNVSIIAILIACMVAFITVMISAWIPSRRATKISAVEAVRQSVDIKMGKKPVKTSKLTYKLFGLPGMLAAKYYKRNKKKYRTTVISLFMSIVLFVSAFSFTNYLMEAAETSLESRGYDLTYYFLESDDETTPEEVRSLIKQQDSVKDAVYAYNTGHDVEVSEDLLTDVAQNAFSFADSSMYMGVCFVQDEAFVKLLEDNNLDVQKYMDKENPIAVVIDGATIFVSEDGKYKTFNIFATEKNEVILKQIVVPEGYYLMDWEYSEDYEPVKAVCANKEDKDDIIELSIEDVTKEQTLKADGIIYEKPYWFSGAGYASYVYPISMYSAVFPDNEEDYYRYYITSDNPYDAYDEIKNALSEKGLSTVELYNYAESVEEERNLVTIVRVFAYGFIVIISLIAAANVFNTIYTNITLRRREFAMLKSVGMTEKGFNKMMNYESLIYGSRALLTGLPVAGLVTFAIYKAVNSGITAEFRLPWTAMGIATLSVFLVVFATMLYSMSRIKKENPIDVLKNENI